MDMIWVSQRSNLDIHFCKLKLSTIIFTADKHTRPR